MARLDPTGVSRILSYIKTWVTTALGGKANSSHSHTKSQITDFPTIPSSTSQLTNDSGYITSSGSCNYANSAGGVAWDNVSGKPSAFTPYFANGTWYAVGDDVAIGDHNVGGGLGVKALNSTTTRIDLCYSNDASNYKSITYDGTTLYMNGNCDYATSAGSCNYANSAGKADYLGDIGSTDRNGTSGTGWYSVGFSYSYDEGHNELAINNYWGIRLNCRDSAHVSINGSRINVEDATYLNGYRIYVG